MGRRTSRLGPLVLAIAVTAAGCWSDAQSEGDPFVYPVSEIVIDPADRQTVYVTMEGGGFFRTTDGGATWDLITDGLPTDRFLLALAADPNAATPNAAEGTVGDDNEIVACRQARPTTLYVGDENSGIFRSPDAGTVWSGPEAIFTDVSDIVVDRTRCQTRGLPCTDLYAGSRNNGVTLSADRGLNWTGFNANLPSTGVSALAIFDGQFPATIYAGTEEGYVFKRRVDASGWTPAEPTGTIDEGIGETEIIELAVSPLSPNVLYAGLGGGEGGSRRGSGLYRSGDGGLSWVNIPRTDRVFTDSVHVVKYVQVTRPVAGTCDDRSVVKTLLYTNINRVSFQDEARQDVWISPALEDDDFATVGVTALGVVTEFETVDQTIPAGQTEPTFYPQILYAGTFRSGVWKSCDGGANFTKLDLTGANDVCQEPGDPGAP